MFIRITKIKDIFTIFFDFLLPSEELYFIIRYIIIENNDDNNAIKQ